MASDGPALPPALLDGRAADLDDATREKLEAAAFRRMVNHLRNRPDAQNIDLMILADFCRNCLSNWYGDAAEAQGVELSKGEAREIVYGMPYDEWKERFQQPATPEQQAAFNARRKGQ